MKLRPLVLAAAVLTLCAGPLAAGPVPILSLGGLSSPVAVGSLFTVNVSISGVTDLASYQFDVGFDPAFASATSVAEGLFLPSAGPTFFVPGTIDNLAGTISFTAGALAGTGPGASGSGVLVSLQFAALKEGTGTFTLLSPLLYDSVPNPIDVTTSNTTVNATAVPEPSAAWLVACCFGAVAVIRRGLCVSDLG